MLRNHKRPFSKRLTEEVKLQYFKILLSEEAIAFFQSQTISTEMTITDVLSNSRKVLLKDHLNDVARCERDQAKCDPTVGTLLDFLIRLEVIAKQAFRDNAAKFVQTFLFGKSPNNIQEDIVNNKKEYASQQKIRTLLHQKQQYNRFAWTTMPQPIHQASSNQRKAPRQASQQQSDVTRQNMRFEGVS